MKKSSRKLLNSAPVTTYLSQPCNLTDNLLQQAMDQLGFAKILKLSKFRKQKGDGLLQVMFALIIWPLLEVRSISNFCGKLISVFIKGGSSVLYDFQKRQDLPWRRLRMSLAKKVYHKNDIENEPDTAFIFDDTLKHRRGKKVEGSAVHYDHTINKCVVAQQVLEMGLASPKGYIPIDSQIFIGDAKPVERRKPFRKSDADVVSDYETALNSDKNTMFHDMLCNAIKSGFKAKFVVGDAWFGNKDNINAVLDVEATALFRMKNSNLKYRLANRDLNAEAIFHSVRYFHGPDKHSQKLPWDTYSIVVGLDLSESSVSKRNVQPVKLVFSVPKKRGKSEFALFLCTDITLSAERILEIYALRWGIEVYFKEIKQYLGFLKEQTSNYAVHYASVHISAIRYLMFSHIYMQNGEYRFGCYRKHVADHLQLMSFASLLWVLFKSLINGVLDRFQNLLDHELLETIKNQIDCTVTEFLSQALQLDPESMLEESRAEKAGTLG